MHSTALLGSLLVGGALAAPYKDNRIAIRDDEIEWTIDLGDKIIEWGCDLDVGRMLQDAVDDLCPSQDRASCIENRSYKEQVSWTGNGEYPGNYDIEISAKGEFKTEDDRDILTSLIVAAANKETVVHEDREWRSAPGGTAIPATGTCPLKKFSNHVKVIRWNGDTQQQKMDVSITFGGENEYSACDVMGDLNTAARGIDVVSGIVEFAVCRSDGD